MACWLIPCSPDIYDAEGAFQELGHVVWHQQCKMEPGDTAYIYVTAPVKAIRCKCRVDSVDIPFDVSDNDEGYVLNEAFCSKAYRRYMDLVLVESYDSNPMLSFEMLQMNGLVGTIRSQRRATPRLEIYLESITSQL